MKIIEKIERTDIIGNILDVNLCENELEILQIRFYLNYYRITYQNKISRTYSRFYSVYKSNGEHILYVRKLYKSLYGI